MEEMKPINQTITDFKQGNCIQACAASIFELKLEEVPNFMEYGPDKFYERIIGFCAQYGLYPMDMEIRNNEKGRDLLRGLYSIGIGLSPRGNHEDQYHGVVCYDGEMVHDPAGKMEGVYGGIQLHTLFIVKDPSKYIRSDLCRGMRDIKSI